MKQLDQLLLRSAYHLREHLRLLFSNPRSYLQRRFGPVPAGYRRRFAMTTHQWLCYHQKHVVFEQCQWMGVRSVKSPLDAWIYQEIIHEVQPDVIIEIGSHFGGTTLYLAHMLDLIGKGRVISIDIDRTLFCVEHPRIVCITGDSSSSQVVAQATEYCQDKTVLVIHDGDHQKEAVLRDLYAYADLVSVNSYFVVEDGIVDLMPPGQDFGYYTAGPLAAIEQFLRNTPNYVVDTDRERYLLTYNPKGFLKRTH